jgi:hypothetical protein
MQILHKRIQNASLALYLFAPTLKLECAPLLN